MDSSVALGKVSAGSPVTGTMNVLLPIIPGSKDVLKPWDPALVSRRQRVQFVLWLSWTSKRWLLTRSA